MSTWGSSGGSLPLSGPLLLHHLVGLYLLDMEPMVRGQPKFHRLVVELSEKWWYLTCHLSVRGLCA